MQKKLNKNKYLTYITCKQLFSVVTYSSVMLFVLFFRDPQSSVIFLKSVYKNIGNWLSVKAIKTTQQNTTQ